MVLKAAPELENVECANCVGLMAQDDLRLSPSEYGEAKVKRRKNGCYESEYTRNGREPGAPGRELKCSRVLKSNDAGGGEPTP